MRLDVLTPCFWPEVRRGTERFVRDLADGLIADGHSPRLITSHPGAPSRRVEDGLPIIRVPRIGEARLERRKFEPYLTHLPFSYAVLSAGNAELAHATTPGDAATAARWSRRTGRPLVFSFMGVPDRVGIVCRRRRLELTLAALRGAAATVVLSRYAADEFRRWFGAEVRTISPGVRLDAFPVAAERTEAPTIICAAAVSEPRKRVDLLVSALGVVRRTRPTARLILDRPRDPALASRYDRPAEGVDLVDLSDRQTIAERIGTAWVSALPSFGEGFGLVLVEALSTGTPVVGSDHGAFPEIVDDPGIGRLFGGDDPAALAAALLEAFELAGDPSTRERCRAAAERYSTARTVAAYEELYAEVLAR